MIFYPDSHLECTLDNFDWSGRSELKKCIFDYCEGKREKGLVLLGNPGVGKTHLMVGMAKYFEEQGKIIGRDFLYMEWSDFLEDLYYGMNKLKIDPEYTLERVAIDYLLLDDIKLGSRRVSRDSLKRLIELMYEKTARAVFSTNADSLAQLIDLWELEDYWVSRLLSRFEILVMGGKDRRLE